MRSRDEVIAQGVPEALWKFLGDACRMPAENLRRIPADALPEPAKQLLVHQRDMTSTLAAFHGSALRVDILQQRRLDDLYLREVFLRTLKGDRIVEYGVIAIAVDQFAPDQQQAIQGGEAPLGALLHRFHIPFASAPLSFFSVPAACLAETPFGAVNHSTCFGRFNHLAKPSGEPLAWIIEILPPAAA
jgi:hypothetical protein